MNSPPVLCTCTPAEKLLLVWNPNCPVHSACPVYSAGQDLHRVAAGNLAFLLSVIRSGERLSQDEENNIRRVIEKLSDGAVSPGRRLNPGAQRFDSEAQAQECAADRGREMWAVRYYPEPGITGKWIVHWWSA
jgi:hypothetical protein